MLRQSRPDGEDPRPVNMPPWHVVLRSLREAAGLTQEGWAAYLGSGRRTVQRWERGDGSPDATATQVLVEFCAERGLLRTYRRGPLSGLNVTAEVLRELMADARVSRRGSQSPAARTAVRESDTRSRQLTLLRQSHTAPHKLPVDLTSFVGRVVERDELARLLDAHRLITLTGAGGVGKTRLAIAVGRDSVGSFSDGVWLVALDDLQHGSAIVQRMARIMGAREEPQRALVDTLIDALRWRDSLLLLDNCEHVLSQCVDLVERILRECAGVRILATSREPLGIGGEIVWRVPSLALPEDDSVIDIVGAGQVESVTLFVDRARAQLPAFELNAANVRNIVRICRKLDGIPLAIELTAARARALSPAEIDRVLDSRFGLLNSMVSGRLTRHQTLRSSIEWSYSLLDADEQLLFDRLSVFPGGFDLEAVERVCSFDGVSDIVDPLARLVDKSLIHADPLADDGVTRYRLLQAVRGYGVERLAARGELDTLHARHARYIAHCAEVVEQAIHGPDQHRWFSWIMRSEASIRTAIDWSLEPDIETHLRICVALCWAWGALGRAREARAWLERILERPELRRYPEFRPRVIALLSMMSILRGDLASADQLSRQVTNDHSERADPVARLVASVARLQIMQDAGDQVATLLADEVKRLAGQLGDTWYMIRLSEILARAALRRGDQISAIAQLEEAVRLARRAGDTWSLAQVLNNLGDVARATGKHAEAGAMYEESLALRESLGIPGLSPSLKHNLGYVALAAGDLRAAREKFRDAIGEFFQTNDRRGIAECLIGLASVVAAQGRYQDAAKLFGAGAGALEALGAEIWPANRADVERWMQLARSGLGDHVFQEMFANGSMLSLDDALDIAESAIPT